MKSQNLTSFRWIAITLMALSFASFKTPASYAGSPMASALAPLAEVPILHDGRVKPLDTFARTHLLAFNSKSSLPDLSAMEWLAEAIFQPEASFQRKIFDIRNPQVIAALEITPDPKHRYAFSDIFPGLQRMSQTLMELHRQTDDQKTPEQKQLLDLYTKAMRFREINDTFALFLGIIPVSPELEKKLDLPVGKQHTFVDVRRVMVRINQLIEAHDPQAKGLEKLRGEIGQFVSERSSEIFKIMPLQWSERPNSSGDWFSPSALLSNGEGSPTTSAYLNAWKELGMSYISGSPEAVRLSAQALLDQSKAITKNHISQSKIRIETSYNRWSLFQVSLAFYLIAFFLILFSQIRKLTWLQKLSFGSMTVALILHLAGLGMRIAIMGRPPVATLYESIIFVSAVVALLSLIYEWVRGNTLGLIAGSVAAASLHFMALGYAADGDTMGMLTAVLNTNFWLATHVVIITTGYGCSIVAGILGHIYLLATIFGQKGPEHDEQRSLLNNNMVGATLIALFFTMFGTILGGIWADQSWGRFWGWDPKENGALLIVLWQLMLLHGRLSGRLRPIAFAAGSVISNAVVAIAWFGVNLLNVGLHSYGFTDSIALNLGLFVGAEAILAAAGYHFATRRTAGLLNS